MHHMQMVAGNSVKQIGFLFLIGPANSISTDEFSEKLISIASDTIPKSKHSVRKHNKVWFNDLCKDAIKNRKKALKKRKILPYIRKYRPLQNHPGQN